MHVHNFASSPLFDQSLHSFFLQTLALKQMILQHRQELVRHTVAH